MSFGRHHAVFLAFNVEIRIRGPNGFESALLVLDLTYNVLKASVGVAPLPTTVQHLNCFEQ